MELHHLRTSGPDSASSFGKCMVENGTDARSFLCNPCKGPAELHSGCAWCQKRGYERRPGDGLCSCFFFALAGGVSCALHGISSRHVVSACLGTWVGDGAWLQPPCTSQWSQLCLAEGLAMGTQLQHALQAIGLYVLMLPLWLGSSTLPLTLQCP